MTAAGRGSRPQFPPNPGKSRLIPLLCLASCAWLAAAPAPAAAETVYRSRLHDFALAPVSAPLDRPWGLAFLPGGGMLVTEKAGALRTVDEAGRVSPPLAGLPPIEEYGQGGLLDVVLHPGFARNRLVYLAYVRETAGGVATAVGRFRLRSGRLDGFETVFTAFPAGRSARHFGSRMAFGPDGKLYVTVGDRGRRPDAQDLSRHSGSVLRLEDDGAAPADNPFVDRPGARPEIWSWGHRNPQGLAFDRRSGRLWSHEHGPRGGDEVNVVERGVNYGWPVITYGRNYIGTRITDETARPGMAQPRTYWTPSIAPSGLAFYDGDRFPGWRGSLFVGALRAETVVRLDLDGDRVVGEERLLEGFEKRVRDVRAGPDGLIYLLLDEEDAPILRLEPR